MSKKLLALTLSLMLVVSSFASTLSVFAAGTTATELKQELKNIAAADFTTKYNLASSLISGKAGSLYYFNVAEGDQLNSIPMYVANSGTANPNALTANSIRADKFHNIGAKTWESGQYVNMKQSNDESQRFYQLNYDIGDVAAIDEIVVAAPFRDSHLVLAPGHYKISVAYNEADLFTAKALTGEFTNANAQTGNNVMIFSATSGDIYGQWIGIRLISTYQPEWEGNANTNNSWGRLEHIGVYGAVCPHEATAPSYDADNHFNACTVCGKQFDVVAHTLDLTNNGENHSEACDCGYASSSAPHAFDKYVNDGDKHHTECICGAKTEAVDHEYGALDKFTKEEKCVCGDVKANDNPFTITNTKGGKAEYEAAVALADSIILGKNVTATYICEATGVTTPTKLPLYRNKSDNSSCNDTETFNHLTTATVLDDGRFYHAGSKAWGGGAFLKLSDGKNLTDDETKAYAQFVYNIGSAAEIDKVSFYSYSNVLNSIGHYKVSFANDAADLFTDAAVYTTPDLYSDGSFSIVDINEGEEFYAKYVGFRLISLNENTSVKGWADGSYFRLNNFAVFGECAHLESDLTPTHDAENHWNECVCGKKFDVEPHNFVGGTCTEASKCACGATGGKLDHEHNIPKYDAENHWKECVCGDKADVEAHDFKLVGDTYVCVCGATLETYKVSFVAPGQAKAFYEVYVTETGLTAEQIEAAKASAPSIFGYTFTGEFDITVGTPILADTTATAAYAKDSTTYAVKIQNTKGSVYTAEHQFDDVLLVTDPAATGWSMNGKLIAAGTSAKICITGDMDIVATTEEIAEPIVAITGYSYKDGKFVVMVQISALGGTITDSGVIYKAGGKTKTINSIKNNGIFMTTMNGVPAIGMTAQAYAVIDGITYVCDLDPAAQ